MYVVMTKRRTKRKNHNIIYSTQPDLSNIYDDDKDELIAQAKEVKGAKKK
jgi:hypothetical protein